MKSIEIQNLDQHLKPLQVDGVSTGIEISTEGLRFTGGTLEGENLVSKKTDHEGDLTIQGDLYLEDIDGSTIYLANGQSIDSKSTDDYITINTQNILVNAFTNFTDANASLFLMADSGFDAQISFMEGASTLWSIGNDGGEGTSTLSFVTGAVLGTNEQMSLNANGLLEVAGDIVTALTQGISVMDLTSLFVFTGFVSGKFTPDVGLLLGEPTAYFIMGIGEMANIEYKIEDDDHILNIRK